MTRDKEEVPHDIFEEHEQGGAKREQSAAPSEASGEDNNVANESAILVSLVDDVVELERGEATVSESVRPRGELQEMSGGLFSIALTGIPQVKQRGSGVDTIVRPNQRIEDDDNKDVIDNSNKVGIPVISSIAMERVSPSTVVAIRPDGKVGNEEKYGIPTIEELEVDQVNEAVTHMVEPSQTASQLQDMDGQFFEIDEKDPVFRWGGGSPYGSNRPKFVVHIDNGEVPSLPFLQVLLRDTYTEIEGGQPGADSVEFVANEPRIPTVQQNIVTLDLTDEQWQPAIRSEKPVIEGEGVDLVSKLQEVAAELYTGQLGYFVLNVPGEWEHPLRRKEFHQKLVEVLAGQEITEGSEEAETLVETVRASPVVLAEPETTERDAFFRIVWRYFSLTPGKDANSIGQVEEVQERVLKQNDWRRVTMTERQQAGEGASDEHYFWKAAIVTGLARTLWEVNDSGITDFDEFVTQYVLSKGMIETEKEEAEGINGTPDIYVNATSPWVKEGLADFFRQDNDQEIRPPVAIEFETGRSEGAFNYRKLRETLEKYEHHEPVYIVVPTRVLFRGRKRAEMINELVQSWTDLNGKAELVTPLLSGGICTGLRLAEDVIMDLYGDNDD